MHMQLQDEEFYQISLDVRGKRTLAESLDSYVSKELMDGQNQYLCEQLGRKVGEQGRLVAQAQGPGCVGGCTGPLGQPLQKWLCTISGDATAFCLPTQHCPPACPTARLLACCLHAGGR
jgi:hypothetical protein